jgi:phosphoglucosamine mutase
VGSWARTSLSGLTVVLDCANGAASTPRRRRSTAQGAHVITIHADPDGLNINENCGSTHMEATCSARSSSTVPTWDSPSTGTPTAAWPWTPRATHRRRPDPGHPGAGDEGGRAAALDTVVATVMSNLGFLQAMAAHGIRVDQTKVGDRYVLESMNANGFALGGEQSGHVIMSEFATTGDGVLTALHVAAQVVAPGLAGRAGLRDDAAAAGDDQRPGVNKARAGIDPGVTSAVTAASRELGDGGRVLLRPSGTEPLVRVMVEAESTARAQSVAERLAAVVKDRLTL